MAEVQLDTKDPYNERRYSSGDHRYKLNTEERDIIKYRELSIKALNLFIASGHSINKVGEEMGITSEEVHSMFLRGEPELKEAIIRRAISMFLDIEGGHTRSDIQDTLGITQRELRTLLKSEEFEEAYNEYFLDMVSHPTIKAVQHQLVEELLPQAFRELHALISADSENVRMKVIFEIFKLAGIRAVEPSKSQRRDLADFLESKNISLDINLNVPDQYSDAMEAVVVEDQVPPTETSDTPDSSQTLALEDGTQ